MLCYITYVIVMLYKCYITVNMCHLMLYNICHVMLYNMCNVMLYNIMSCDVI